MARHESGGPAHLFMLKVWEEPLGPGQVEWRGKVQHSLSGETCYFRNWDSLTLWLVSTLGANHTPTGESGRPDEQSGVPDTDDPG